MADGTTPLKAYRYRSFLTFTVPPATVLVFLLLAEAVLRLLPVSGSLQVQPVTERHPILHFAPNRDFVWSRNWNFSQVNSIHVNNAGFVNQQDYAVEDGAPAIAVIGDSFVEATIVPPGETLHARLADRFKGRARVMSFGASGAALSQYLVWADHARRVYRPAAMIFVVVGNDFDQSLMKYKHAPGFHYFVEGPDGLKLSRVNYDPGFWRRRLRHSALIRYLVLNVRIGRFASAIAKPADFIGNMPAHLSETVVADAGRAVRAFLDQAPQAAGLSPEHIFFVVDGLRAALYDAPALEQATNSYFVRLRKTFMDEANARGFTVIDLGPLFATAYARDGRRFEYPDEGHWNGYTHGLAAQAAGAALTAKWIASERQ